MAEPAADPEPPARRRRFALSVRGLMLLVLLVGGPIGWEAGRAESRRRSVEAIRRLGGWVWYDWQMGPAPASAPPGPTSLRRWVGDDHFQRVVRAVVPIGPGPDWTFDSSKGPRPFAADTEHNRAIARIGEARQADRLAWLEGLDGLEHLNVDGLGSLDPEALERLGRLDRLRGLSIAGVTIHSTPTIGRLAGLEELHLRARADSFLIAGFLPAGRSMPFDLAFLDRLPRLRRLDLNGVTVDAADVARIGRRVLLEHLSFEALAPDAGLDPLAGHPSLRSLSIQMTPGLADAGLAPLAGLARLEHLGLQDAPLVTDAGLARLAGLRSLATLEIRSPAITDSGLARLAGLANLATLDLGYAELAGPGLEALRGLSRLTALRFSGKRVDPAAVARLKAAIPGLYILLR